MCDTNLSALKGNYVNGVFLYTSAANAITIIGNVQSLKTNSTQFELLSPAPWMSFHDMSFHFNVEFYSFWYLDFRFKISRPCQITSLSFDIWIINSLPWSKFYEANPFLLLLLSYSIIPQLVSSVCVRVRKAAKKTLIPSSSSKGSFCLAIKSF